MSLLLTSPERAPVRLDRSRHAAPQVFECLRDAILALELEPGTQLSRSDLALRFGVSQTPVRDALMRLGAEGLVDIYPQHATVVSRIDLGSALQAQFLRRSIELEIVHTLARASDRLLLARLRATLALQHSLHELGRLDEFAAGDQAFHRQLYEAAEVPELWTLVCERSGHLDRLRRLHLPVPGKAAAIVRDHGRIIDAIDAGDVTAAQQALREHLSGTLSQLDQIRQRHPHFLTAG